MKSRHTLFSVITCLILAGCGGIISEMHGIPIVNPADPADVAAHTTVTYDRHENKYTFQGPIIYAQRNITGHIYLLRTWGRNRDVGPGEIGQVYVLARLDDWAFLNAAYSEGSRLRLTTIDREVGSCVRGDCSVTESVGINFTMAQISSLAERKFFSVKITGPRGHINLDIPGAYFAGFLEGMKSRKVKTQ